MCVRNIWPIFSFHPQYVASHSKQLQLIPHGIAVITSRYANTRMHSCNHGKLCQRNTLKLQQASKTTRTVQTPLPFLVFKCTTATSSQSLTWGTDTISISCLRAELKVTFRVFPLIRPSEGLHSKHPCPAETEPGWTLIGFVFGFNELWASGPPTHTIHGQTCVKGQAASVMMGLVRALRSECTCSGEISSRLSWSYIAIYEFIM